MPAFTRTRINDASFSMNLELRVIDANRSFASLFDITDININLADYMDETDSSNLKFFLSNLPQNTTKIFFCSLKSIYDNVFFTLETTAKKKNLFFVKLHIFDFAKEAFVKVIQENLELKTVLKTFDRYYFIYDGHRFFIKFSKEQASVFRGSADEFKNYITVNFKIDLKGSVNQLQMAAMIFDIQKFKTKKVYKFLMENKKVVKICPEIYSADDYQLVIGTIALEEKNLFEENLYTKNKDGLTDMFNKKSITEQAIHKVDVLKEPCALIILDIDKFKDYNDTFGHAYGDKVIVAVANVIKDAVKDIGVAGRIGGDEFMAIVNTNSEEDIRNVTRNIRLGINWSITNPDAATVVTCSMGIARSPLNTRTYEELFKLADKCLYIAKNKGRNCYVIYKPEIHDKVIIKNEQALAQKASGKSYNDDADSQIAIVKMVNELVFGTAGYLPNMNKLIPVDVDIKTKNQTQKLKEILDAVRLYMEVTQVTLYKADKDKKLRALYISGDKKDFREDFFCEDYFKYYNSYNFLHLDNTTNLDTIDKNIHKMYTENQVASVLEFVYKDNDGVPLAQISFDIYKPARTFEKSKVVFALTMAKVLTNII
mgnify:CR=1 FL=1